MKTKIISGIVSAEISEDAENLILNGDFSNGMDNWSQSRSQNMTINATEGFCNLSTIHTDYFDDYTQSHFDAGTFYNSSSYDDYLHKCKIGLRQ